MLHARRHFTPDGVLAVEEGGVVEADEKLAVRAVRIGGAGHGTNAAHMRFAAELCLDVGQLRPAHAGARRIAALRHEAGDDAVEHHTVIEAVLGKGGDAFDMAGRQIGAQLDDDVAAAVEGEGKRFVGHVCPLRKKGGDAVI